MKILISLLGIICLMAIVMAINWLIFFLWSKKGLTHKKLARSIGCGAQINKYNFSFPLVKLLLNKDSLDISSFDNVIHIKYSQIISLQIVYGFSAIGFKINHINSDNNKIIIWTPHYKTIINEINKKRGIR